MSGNTVFGKDFLKTPSFRKFCLHTSPPPSLPSKKIRWRTPKLEKVLVDPGSDFRYSQWQRYCVVYFLKINSYLSEHILRNSGIFLQMIGRGFLLHINWQCAFITSRRLAERLQICSRHLSSMFGFFSELLWNPSNDELFTVAVYQISL